MNQRAIQLYQQAAAFAYQTAGADAGRGTIVESLTAGKFAELIVAECMKVSNRSLSKYKLPSDKIAEHFGVES
jgi:hypothetical protein